MQKNDGDMKSRQKNSMDIIERQVQKDASLEIFSICNKDMFSP